MEVFGEIAPRRGDMPEGFLPTQGAGGMVSVFGGGDDALPRVNLVPGAPKVLVARVKTIAPFRTPHIQEYACRTSKPVGYFSAET